MRIDSFAFLPRSFRPLFGGHAPADGRGRRPWPAAVGCRARHAAGLRPVLRWSTRGRSRAAIRWAAPRTEAETALRATSLRALVAVVAFGAIGVPAAGWAFPPYRSTDAEAAPPGLLEVRLGLLRAEREDHDTHYISPLLRLNLGIARNVEFVSELEYEPEDGRLGDGALGFKWALPRQPLSIGVETLALLPVSSVHSGAGVESQLLATLRGAPFQLHLNAGGFYDSRLSDIERGWRASVLGEWERGRARLGTELFAKQVHGESALVQGGPGIIVSLGPFDVRASLHVGLTSEAPDLMANLWVSTKRELW